MYIIFTCNCFPWSSRSLHVKMMYIIWFYERDLFKKCCKKIIQKSNDHFLKYFLSRSRSREQFMYIIFTCNCFPWSSRSLHVKMMYIIWFYERDLFKKCCKTMIENFELAGIFEAFSEQIPLAKRIYVHQFYMLMFWDKPNGCM